MIDSSAEEKNFYGFVSDGYFRGYSDKEIDKMIGEIDITPANVRWGSRHVIIKTVVRDWVQGKEIPLETTKALLSRTVQDLMYIPEVIWPQMSEVDSVDNKFLEIRLGREEDYVIPKGNPIFPKGLPDFDDFDALRTVSFMAASKLNGEDQKKVTQWIMSLETAVPRLDQSDFNKSLLSFILVAKDPDSVFSVVADFIYDHKDKYTYKLSEYVGGQGQTYVDEIVTALATSSKNLWLVKYLADCRDDEKVKKMLGIFVDECGFPRIINSIRSYIIKTGDKKAERIGRFLLGKNPNDDSFPFHKLLRELYESIDFENYAPNLEVNEFELNMVDQLLKKEGLSNGVVLDLACGTGRIANGLALKGYDHIIGIDISDENLQKAKASDSTKKVDYRNADIIDLKLDDASVDAAIFIGRSSTHAENEEVFCYWLKQIKRVLKPNGIILIDFPNANKGGIYKSHEDYVRILQNLGLPISVKEGLRTYDYLADSPDRKNLYNRWIPKINLIKRIFKGMHGFDIEIYARRHIANAKGDENVYFLARNTKKENPSWITQGGNGENYWIPF